MKQAQANQVKPIIKQSENNPDVRICYKSQRAVSTIVKMPDGNYVVVKLYEGEVVDCPNYSKASKEAKTAAMTQAPRTTEDAA